MHPAEHLSRLLPFALLILAGFVAGRLLKVDKEQIARLLIFFITPSVVFLGLINGQQISQLLAVPLCYALISGLICILIVKVCPRWFSMEESRLLALGLATGNTGYFGIPAVSILLGPAAVPAAILCALGQTLFENSLGYYVISRHKVSRRQALHRVLRLPTLHVFWICLITAWAGWQWPALIVDTATVLKGAYAPLGMMIVGIGLATAGFSDTSMRLLLFACLTKPLIWLVLVTALLWLDAQTLKAIAPLSAQVMLLQALTPMAANTVAFASETGCAPQKAAVLVMASTIVGFLLMPWAAYVQKW